MKIKYITAIGALGSILAIVPPCTAVYTSTPTTSAGPASAVWDGSEYVGPMNGTYYYLGPNNIWVPMDQTRLQRFQEWQKNNPNLNPYGQQGQNTRSAGAVNPNAQPGQGPVVVGQPVFIGQPVVVGQQNPSETNPNWEPNPPMENTRSKGAAVLVVTPVSPSRIQNNGETSRAMEQNPTWEYPSGRSTQVRNTRYQGHDMGQTRAPAPPIQETQLP